MTTTRTFVEGRYVPAGPWADAKIKSQVQHLKSSFRTGERREEERTLFDAHGTVADVAAARAILTAAIGPKVVLCSIGSFSPWGRARAWCAPSTCAPGRGCS